ncbi:hypothetical protein B0J13DRAFT_509293 [Dactylonectria estremocensis]|uniref:Nephrocystin 3-like N-terminal domain-containing protein n=1 Tax=Dactylonectria estremocensis TaxID=1079267 RepID=A0A9P9E4P7_9HYPO|nr:hypothetical protein B0J13DRAFT_509293 [Dactylonectria estremocensis]
MAEAVGVAAAAAQFAGLSIKIIKTTKAIHDKLKDAPYIQERLHEIEDLQKLVAEVNRYPELQNPHTTSILESCVKISDRLCHVLNELNFSADDPIQERTWKAIAGMMKEEEVRALFSRLETAKSTLGAKIGLETFIQQRSVVREMRTLKLSGPAASDEDKCLRFLFQTDPALDRDGILSAKGDMTTGTCTWITSTEEYKKWARTPPHLLWISAPPGMGKTYLSIYLSTHLEDLAQDSVDVTTIFFFCDNQAQFRNTAVDILRGLIYQLIQQQKDLVNILLAYWKIQPDAIFEGHSLETLWRVFRDMIKAIRSTTVYCVLDALDECEETALSVLLRKLAQLATSDVADSKMRLIALSRRAPAQLAELFSSFVELQVDQQQAMKEDVERFVSVEVLKLARKKHIVDLPLHHHIEETFRQKSESTFLWSSFMLRELESQSLTKIESSLENLPRGLDAVYDQILSRIEPEKMDRIAEMLNWIISAPQHLPITKLCEAIGLKSTANLTREEVCLDYIKCCGHLLQTTLQETANLAEIDTKDGDAIDVESCIQRDEPLWPFEVDEPNAESFRENDEVGGKSPPHTLPYYWRLNVTFLHQSARDYLLKPSSRFKPYLVPTQKMHELVTDQLIGYLCRKDNSRETGVSGGIEHLLECYSVCFWSFHFAKLDDISELIKRHKDFFGKRSDIRRHWGTLYFRHLPKAANSRPPPILYMATELDLYNLAAWYLRSAHTLRILRPSKSLEERWGKFDETSLQLACRLGNVRFVKLLVEAGANLNPRNSGDGAPLHLAALTGRMDVFQILLASKQGKELADQEKRGRTGCGNLLKHAVFGGNEELCRLLVKNHHWDVEGGDPDDLTPLGWALARGNVDLARTFASSWQAKTDNHAFFLIGINNIRDTNAFRSTVNLLVRDWGVDLNTAVNEKGCNILCCCFQKENIRIIHTKLDTLIAFGANPAQRNCEGKTVLHCASLSFRFACLVVKTQLLEYLLRDGRLHINDGDNDKRTILTNLVSRMLYFVGKGSEKATCRRYLKYGPPALRRLLDLGADRFGGCDSKTVLTLAIKLSINEGRSNLEEADFWMYHTVIEKARDVLDNYSTVPVDLAQAM